MFNLGTFLNDSAKKVNEAGLSEINTDNWAIWGDSFLSSYETQRVSNTTTTTTQPVPAQLVTKKSPMDNKIFWVVGAVVAFVLLKGGK